KGDDLRREIFQLVVDKHWILLELRREAQSLDAVFRDLTRRDEALDRGDEWDEDDDEDLEDEETSDEAEDEDDDDDEDEQEEEETSDDEDDDDDDDDD